ncbi:hypothetical protein [Weissella soli]|uniref:hypothetical protein n=1 Tax=Weissella soli TaxID=155866 RepID=UPI00359FBEA2
MKRILGATVILIAIIAVIASVNFTMQQQHSQQAASVATSKARAAKASRKHAKSVSEKRAASHSAAVASAAKNINSATASTKSALIQDSTFTENLESALLTNTTIKKKVTIQSILVNGSIATVTFKDNTALQDLSAYLNTYAQAATLALQATKDTPVKTIRIARQLAGNNGSQFGVATSWSGDQLKHGLTLSADQIDYVTFINAASRYQFAESAIYNSFDTTTKNKFKNLVAGGLAKTDNNFTTWFASSITTTNSTSSSSSKK